MLLNSFKILLLRVQQLPGEAATLQVGLKNEVISFDFEQVFVKCPSLPQMRHFRTPVRRYDIVDHLPRQARDKRERKIQTLGWCFPQAVSARFTSCV